MGLALQVIVFVFFVSLFLQRSAGSNISPSPSVVTVIPPIEGLPVIPIVVNAPISSSLPNVSQIPPLIPPVISPPASETGTGPPVKSPPAPETGTGSPVNSPPTPDTGTGPPVNSPPAPETGTEPPINSLPTPETGTGSPINSPPTPQTGTGPPINSPPTPEKGTIPPINSPPAPETGTRSPINSPPAPDIGTRPPINSPPTPETGIGPPINSPPAPEIETEPPINSPPTPDIKTEPPINSPPTPEIKTEPPINSPPTPETGVEPPINSPPAPDTGTGGETAPTLSPKTPPPSSSHELVTPPIANPPHNQNPINNSSKPVPVAPVPVTTPPSRSLPKPPIVSPVMPRLDPPITAPNVAPPTNKAPPLKPQAPEPTPPPSPSRKIDGPPVVSPPKRKFQPISPESSPPLKAPPVHKRNASSPHNTISPLSSPKSPPVIRPQAPASLPSVPSHGHHHRKENITASPSSSLHTLPPPPSHATEKAAFSPKSHAHNQQKSHATPPSPSPLAKDDGLPDSSHPLTSPPRPTPLPVFSPKASPSGPSPSHTERPILPPIHALPPPPPNKDCSPLTCAEPYTNTPPGSPCGCVWPMQVGLRLGVALYTFFPLVSELAEEISIGVFMRQSQVRIMGANAANQDPEKTIVLIDLVPLGEKFDNTTAYLTADRFWNKEVVIHSSVFGNYEVLYVRYPGLPPSPPSSVNADPYFSHDDNGRSVKPLSVNVSGVHHKRNNLSGSVVAIIVLAASVVLVLSIAVFWVVLSKRSHGQQDSTPPLSTLPCLSKPSGIAGPILGSVPSSETLSIQSGLAPYTGSAKTFSSSDIEKATDSFNATRVLGEGGFGRVYSGILSDGTEVAVKVLKRDDQQGGREFLAEVEMLSRLHHRNLVKLIGICTEDRARCLVYEIVRNGSVDSHLHGADKDIAPLDWGSRLKIALGSARALAYLHEDSSPRVIHRDFKSSNILLEEDFTPKVSDFGLARTALEEENKHVSTRVMGTFGYVAPEYAMTGHLLVKSDVYSYGVVLLELLTGKKPVDMSQPPGRENLVSWVRPLLTNQEDLETIIDPSLGPDFPFDSIAKVSAIASMCVQPEVSHRPFMGEVVQALKLVCNECDMANNLESRSCSHEDLLDTQSPLSNYDCGLDVESGYSGSASDIFRFKRLQKQDDGSFRRHSSSGPLRTGRGDNVWHKMRRFSGGTVSEHGTKVRFWSGSH